MKTRVLDSWAILEWMSGRKPADTYVAALLAEGESGKARLLMSAIKVGEIHCFSERTTDQPWRILSVNRRALCRLRSKYPQSMTSGTPLLWAIRNSGRSPLSIPQELPDLPQPLHVVAHRLEGRCHGYRQQQPRRVP